MPELPEVETLCRQMSSVMVGAEVYRLKVLDAKLGKGLELRGRRVQAVNRRGKWVVIRLDEGIVVRLHLRMTGRLLWREHVRENIPHTRLTIIFDRGRLDLIDPRRFAVLSFEEWPDHLEPVDDPLEGLDAGKLRTSAANRRLPIKSFLLDQKVIAGVGNIYACEILYAAAIHPFRSAGSLSKAEWQRIVRSAGTILPVAVDCRGTSVSDWRDLFGRMAEYQNHLRVYGRAGKRCDRCGGAIVRERQGGRGTFFCPVCQH